MGSSRKKKCDPPVEDINDSRGLDQKYIEFQGDRPKFEEKFEGGGHDKINWKSRGINFKKMIFSTWEAHTN